MRTCRLKVVEALLVACAFLVAACGSPTGPTPGAATQPAASAALGPMQFSAEVVRLNPQELAAQGWVCRPVPSAPNLIQCSPPNQGFPVIPPPDNRPPTYNFLLWDGATFLGQVLLIRSDLYRGQICQSTGQPYRFIELAGYYECLHKVGS